MRKIFSLRSALRGFWGAIVVAGVLGQSFASADVTVDNRDAATSQTGLWQVSGGTNPFDPADPLADSVWARGGSDTFTWHFAPTETGDYEVWEWHSGWSSRTSAAPHEITHAGGTTNVLVNQKVNAGKWNSLGVYQFRAGESYRVTVTSVADTSSTCADAVRWTFVAPPGNSPPTATIDSISPNPAGPYDLVTFAGSGSDDDGTISSYYWESSLDGYLGNLPNFTTSAPLSPGTHTIVFTVTDNDGASSPAATANLVVFGEYSTSDYIIDNGDPGTSYTGSWSVSGGPNPWDPNDPNAVSLWSRDGTTYTWRFTPLDSGTYEVFMWWTEWSSRSTTIPVSVQHGGGTESLVINQRTNGGQWNSLGTFTFAGGVSYSVTITSQPGPSSTCADAVRFTLAGSVNPPPVAIIDDITPTAVLPGDVVSFMGSGSDAGSVAAYEWSSDIDGLLSNQAAFSTNSLSPGTHSIFFRVRDGENTWSSPATALVVVRDCNSPVSIMPVGDSITQGYGEISDPALMTGYRAILHHQLEDGGYNVDFVGNRAEGQYALPPFDINHQGIGGISASYVASNVYDWLAENPAEIVLLHIGRNNFTTSPAAVEAILNEIDQYEADTSRDVTVVLALIINRYPYHPETTVFNDNVKAMAQGRIAAGDKIVIVDQESALNYSTDMWDSVHPNNLGYAKMSGPWMDALTGLIPTCSAFKPFIYTAPPESASTGIEYFYQAAAIGNPTPEYSLLSAPEGMTIEPDTGGIAWVPISGDEGAHTVILRASNTVGTNEQEFILYVGTVPIVVVVDNNDPGGTSWTGQWEVSGGTNPFDPADPSADSLWARGGDDTFTWHFTPAQTGAYEVWEWHSGWSSRTSAAPHDITHDGGMTTVIVNQKINAGMWNSLGMYQFTAGGSYRVTVTSVADDSSTCADAVRWTLVQGGAIAPTAIIDSITPNPANEGQTVTFSGHGDDLDGVITSYRWRSNINGALSSNASFSTSSLAAGNHSITLEVQDNDGLWSAPATRSLTVNALSAGDEHIFYCMGYGGGVNPVREVENWLSSNGAVKEGGVWTYTNSLGKKHVIHFVQDIEGMRQALMTDGAHVLYRGHANYGLGALFPTDEERLTGVVEDIYYIDDPRIFAISSPWFNVSIRGLRTSQAFPNWWPVFQDGSSGLMPYDFGEAAGFPPFYFDLPPYNYYISYQMQGDPSGAHHLAESAEFGAIQRFPDSRTPAWYDIGGMPPDPNNPDHLQYFLTNPEPWEPSLEIWGNWFASVDLPGFYRDDYLYLPAGVGLNEVEYLFTIAEPGNYRISAWWPASSSNTASAKYTVHHASGTSDVFVNQRTNGAMWNEIGQYYFANGSYSVIISDHAASGTVIADGVRIEALSNPPSVIQAHFNGDNRYGPAPLEVVFSSDSTGDITSFTWDLGDGTTNSTRTLLSHTYTTPGTYSISLTVNGAAGTSKLTKPGYIVVGSAVPPLRAEFSGNRQQGVVPLESSFQDMSSGQIVSWSWDFDNDGIEDSNEPNPAYTYLEPGNYNVRLTVTDKSGNTSTEYKPNFVLARLYDKSIDNVDYPKVHYLGKTILFRKDPGVAKDELGYKRLFYEGCNTGNYFLDTFSHGIVFYTLNTSHARGFYTYLKNYMDGKSDEEIWRLMQAREPIYDYYDFNKLPSQQ
jgi:PKD repeat protein/lysophospholipase L1-like esterase